jgi:ABC-2 type transport system permease protein
MTPRTDTRASRVLVRAEWRLLHRDRSVWITMAAMVIALTAGWLNASGWTQLHQSRIDVLLSEQDTRLRDLQARMDKEREGLLAKGLPLSPVLFQSRHATQIGHYSGQRWMVQPLLPTTPLAIGETDLQPLGHMASVDRWQGQARAEPTSALWQRFPRFDVFFVVAYLLPLALIVTCAGVIAAERDAGTLRLRAAQGGRLPPLAVSRVATRCALLSGAAITVVGIGLVSTGGLAVASWPHLAIWSLAVLAYAAFWGALLLWIDSWGQSTGVNLLVSAAAWLVLLFVAPGLVRVAADWTRPVESRALFEQARREAYQDTWGTLTNKEVLDAFYKAHPDIPPSRDEVGGLERYGIYQMRLLEIMRETLLPLEEVADVRAAAYRRFVAGARFGSPLMLLLDLSTTAAGTDSGRLENFLAQRDAFLEEWDRFYVTRIYTREPIEDLNATPVFIYRETTLGGRALGIAASFAGLCLPAGLFGLAAVRRYRQSAV